MSNLILDVGLPSQSFHKICIKYSLPEKVYTFGYQKYILWKDESIYFGILKVYTLKNKVYTFKYKKYILYEQGKLHPILNNKSSIVFE